MPFLENVTRGRNIPKERLAQVADQYLMFGGKSPINGQNLELMSRTRLELARRGIDLPLFFANRNWAPYLDEVASEMADLGISKALVLATSAYGSYSGCRQYREDLARASELVEASGRSLEFFKLRHFYSHPGFIEPLIKVTLDALDGIDGEKAAAVLCTAHSIPESMAAVCDYRSQLGEVASAISQAVRNAGRTENVSLAFQSRSGPPSQPWLEPDVNDVIRKIAADGIEAVIVVPIGFVSDHMEVVYDLDVLARSTATELGLSILRLPTASHSDSFTKMIADLVEEELDEEFEAPTYPGMTRASRICSETCCIVREH